VRYNSISIGAIETSNRQLESWQQATGESSDLNGTVILITIAQPHQYFSPVRPLRFSIQSLRRTCLSSNPQHNLNASQSPSFLYRAPLRASRRLHRQLFATEYYVARAVQSRWPSSCVPRSSERPSRSPAGSLCAAHAHLHLVDDVCRYTDLQPVGMGAFGLVWYGYLLRPLGCATLTVLRIKLGQGPAYEPVRGCQEDNEAVQYSRPVEKNIP
jgi:hypothetical protein